MQSTTIPICLENIYLKSVKFCPLNSPLIYNTDLKDIRLHLVILDYLGLKKRQRGGSKVVHVRDGIGNEQGNKHTPSTVNIFPFFFLYYAIIYVSLKSYVDFLKLHVENWNLISENMEGFKLYF